MGAAAPPLVGVLSSPRAASALPERGRLCAVPDEVELIAIGASRDGEGLVAHVLSHAAAPIELEVAFPDLPVGAAATGDHLERPRTERLILPGELLTVRLGSGA